MAGVANGPVRSLLTVFYGMVAQLVEQRTENPCVGGSTPPRPTIMGIMESSVPYYNSGRETEFESRMSANGETMEMSFIHRSYLK